MNHNEVVLNHHDILKSLPHRAPFALVDRVVRDEDDTLYGIKNISMSEPAFIGHFPDNPIYPGVLVIESMAQFCGLYFIIIDEIDVDVSDLKVFLISVDRFKIKTQIVPGDVLVLHTEIVKKRGLFYDFDCYATVNGKKVASAAIRTYCEITPKNKASDNNNDE